MVNHNKYDRKRRSQQHVDDGTRRNQQQADRKRAAIDVEMAERVHKILQEKRRARHEHEQRQMFLGEAKRFPKEFYKKPERDQPDRTVEREHQPDRHF